MNADCTIILHGPLEDYSLIPISQYMRDYKIVVVAPMGVNPNIADEVLRISKKTDNVSLILYQSNMILKEGINNEQNRYFHHFSVLMGLQFVNTKYAIKIRSDEYYSNLEPFLDIMRVCSNKIITNDVFFRKKEVFRFHPSDHLVGGTTKNMENVFHLATLYSENRDTLVKARYYSENINVAEQYLGLATINALVTNEDDIPVCKTDLDLDYYLMNKCFDIVPSQRLGFFRIRANTYGKFWTNNEYFSLESDIKDIKNY
jgi:hypothetical protein